MDLLDDDGLLDLRRRGRATDPEEVVRELQQGEGRQHGKDPADDGTSAAAQEQAWGQLRRDPQGGQGTADEAADAASGTCPICRKRPGRMACRSCARTVCKADAWVMFGLCRTCAKEDRVRNWHSDARPEGDNWLEEP